MTANHTVTLGPILLPKPLWAQAAGPRESLQGLGSATHQLRPQSARGPVSLLLWHSGHLSAVHL